jgi:hypothetical protein
MPIGDHLSLTGTCRELQEALRREVSYREQIDALMEARDDARYAARYLFDSFRNEGASLAYEEDQWPWLDEKARQA